MSPGPESALVANVFTETLQTEPFDPAQVIAGSPSSGWSALTNLGGYDVGIWEMTAGVVTDTEVDEVFCVLAGRGLVEFVDPPAAPLELGPGALVRLRAGWRTRWTVTETLRKIAVTEGEDSK